MTVLAPAGGEAGVQGPYDLQERLIPHHVASNPSLFASPCLLMGPLGKGGAWGGPA